jgi:hypothetical protein
VAFALAENLKVWSAANLGPVARSRILSRVARTESSELILTGRASTSFTKYIDGNEGAEEETVSGAGAGVIIYRFNYLAPAVAFALTFLRARAPSATGQLRSSFFISVDGRIIPANQINYTSIPPGADIIIGNTQPYNRRADVQKDGTRGLHFNTPAGMYDDCVSAVRRRFGKALTAKREYSLSFPGQYILRQDQKHLTGKRIGRVHRAAGKPVESPGMSIHVS